MGKLPFVLDSSIVINHLNKKLDIEEFFKTIAPDTERIISIVTYMETLAKSDMTPYIEQEAMVFLASCKTENISNEIRDETIKLRRINPYRKLPDCIIMATAVSLKATLLSNDPHLLNMVWPGLVVKWLS